MYSINTGMVFIVLFINPVPWILVPGSVVVKADNPVIPNVLSDIVVFHCKMTVVFWGGAIGELFVTDNIAT